jgi:chemotaxis protein CheZ
MTEAERLQHLETKLQKDISAACQKAAQPPTADDIGRIVRQVITSLSGDLTAADLKFYAELEELAAYINHAKQEIAEIKPAEINSSHIPHATNELDAVVGATEEATNKIMDVCDEISTIAAQCTPEFNEQLVTCTTKIFEACNFQDITGQRITKVVNTLKYIDAKIAALLSALGDEINRGSSEGATHKLQDPEKALLNGPQLPQNAMDQDTIDRLLSN